MSSVRCVAAAAIFVLGFLLMAALPLAGAQDAAEPRLLVLLVIDQMRQDYIDRMAPRWTAGLKRLVTEGAVFERNRYPYLQTVTCAGHATIGTGSFPATHGILLNAWWRGTRTASCTEDFDASAIGYEAGAEAAGHSASQLLVPTLADRVRERSPASRVVTLSIKPRSAIMLAGHGGVVTWLDDHNVWATSSAFSPAPDRDVETFVTAHPRQTLREVVWERAEPAEHYTGNDEGIGEAPPRGWTKAFPHPLAGAPGTAAPQFYTLWETSPFADAYLGRMAADLVARKGLGKGTATDVLGVSFSALDYVGHAFGPDSHEVQDTLLRLDATIGELLTALDQQVGRGRYVVGLSADHGVAPIPEARTAGGAAGGRLQIPRLLATANEALVQQIGPGQHVVRVEYTQVYLSDAAQRAADERPELLQPVIEALQRLPGVERVLRSSELLDARASSDAIVRAAALSYVPGRSGQLVVIPQPYYVIGGATAVGTTHGTHQIYDQHVPLIFFGAGVKAGRYEAESSPADLAPTLASRIGLTLTGADGRVRSEAFVPE